MLNAQELYWRLVEEGKPEPQWSRFCREHDGETFRAFRPEWIERAIDPSVKPLSGLGSSNV